MKRILSLCLGLVALVAVPVMAQAPAAAPTGKIHGHVINPTGAQQGTGNVTCLLSGKDKGEVLQVNGQGEFTGDLAPGTGHLRTTLAQGEALMRALRGRVSGLCQPDYVLDIPGGHGKVPIGPQYITRQDSFAQDHDPGGESRYRVIDYCGDVHLYPPQSRGDGQG